jgi:hypothetical protein
VRVAIRFQRWNVLSDTASSANADVVEKDVIAFCRHAGRIETGLRHPSVGRMRAAPIHFRLFGTAGPVDDARRVEAALGDVDFAPASPFKQKANTLSTRTVTSLRA